MRKIILVSFAFVGLVACRRYDYDTIIRNGTVYDGNGGVPYKADIGIKGDMIAFIGDLSKATAKDTVDASGKAVAPGFINMLSWSPVSLIEDYRSMGELKEGVTLEVFGEGESMGPLNERMKKDMQDDQPIFKYKVDWTSLGGYMRSMEKRGISVNIASYVGATTIRTNVVGEDDRAPTAAELDSMKLLVREAMEEGALGVGSSLIYPPAFFAKTNELIELCKAAAPYGGGYISHMRSEGNKLNEAVEELITIAREAKVHGEIYHLKAAGISNWGKMDSVIRRVERARKEGIDIAANMYTYTAGATGMTAAFPPSLQDGGFGKLWQRLQDPKTREETKKAMKTNAPDWENLYYGAGSADKVLLLGFRRDSLFKYAGKSLAEVARIRNTSPEDAAIDLIIQDSSRVEVAYFLMSEENVKKQLVLPWVSFGSDAASMAPEGKFLKQSAHPRAYGNFTRVIGHYSRDEKLLSLQEAIRKLTKLAASSLHISKRGELKPGYFADIIVFDPATVNDKATYERPHQYSEGMLHVWVNGVQVLKNGNHTLAKPGRFVKGPGYKN
ncbi:MAG: D-aminoacylase [Chitinophagaceae bacterium]|nr:D-aminoacylase [Chitinophagaceae bacterium]